MVLGNYPKNITPFPGGDAQLLALANGKSFDPIVLSQNTAGSVHNWAGR